MRLQLLVRRGALGDTVLVEPIARAMRAERPELALCMAGVEENVRLMRHFGVCVEAFSTEVLAARLAEFERVVGDDAALSTRHPSVQIFDPRLGDEVRRPAARELLDRAGYAQVEDATPSLLDAARRTTGSGVLLHPGSGSPRKCRDLGFWCEVARRLHSEPVATSFIVGHVERERGMRIDRLAGEVPVIQPGSAIELAELLQRAAAFAGHDSGPTHLAAALGLPTLAVFVATDPRVWAPPRAQVFEGTVSAAEFAAAITSATRRRATDGCR